jgi:hypothetical protein
LTFRVAKRSEWAATQPVTSNESRLDCHQPSHQPSHQKDRLHDALVRLALDLANLNLTGQLSGDFIKNL